MSVLSMREIDLFESELGHGFPEIYRELLATVGHGEQSGNRSVYHPLKITDLYEFHFENDGDLFGRFFPIGCNNREQTIWLVDVTSGKVATIYHDTHPDDYADEEWLVPAEWKRHEKFC